MGAVHSMMKAMDAQRSRAKQVAVVQVRRELKHEVSEAAAQDIGRFVERELPLRARFHGERDAIVRSVYLDYEDRSLASRALATPNDSTKVRYKRYDDPSHRSGTNEVSVWVEVKVRTGNMVTKERVPYPGVLLAGLFGGTQTAPESQLLGKVLARGPLLPLAGVQYLRTAFEDANETLRVTIDREVTFAQGASTRGVGQLDGCIVEVKTAGDVPAWLEEILADHPQSSISKFESAVRALGIER